jgi:HAD superfamily phosphoserine phosphatase-like hydrolase
VHPAQPGALAIFVDYDGTITNVDTFDLLVRSSAGDGPWDAIEADIANGTCTLRRALERQAALIHMPPEEAFALVEREAHIDPSFLAFVDAAKAAGSEVTVVSSGLRQMIEPRLHRLGVQVPIVANDVTFDPAGWRLSFVDESDNGHDKAARVRAAHKAGKPTVYIGDGISDFEAALAADTRFAKKGRALERHCNERGIACTSFTTFDEVGRAMFGATLFSRPGPSSLDRASVSQ